jgi:hypothetical protein
MMQCILVIPVHADTDKPTIFDSKVPVISIVITGVVPAVIVLIIAATVTIIIGQIYREKHRKQKLQFKRQLSENKHKEEEKQIEVNHKEKEHELDLDHEYRLECLKAFKELLLKEPKDTVDNLKELMKFLNADIAPLLDPSNRKRNQQMDSIPPASECDHNERLETDEVDMVDGPGVDETDFGHAPSLTNGTEVADVLDADELEVMELLSSFIESAQASLQQHSSLRKY